jgi:23S rRNA (cytosine1962-C5)-methyltransferase
MPSVQGFLRGEGSTRIKIREGTARFIVDVAKGQKTGWFCDQRENRLAAASLARGARVLDAFCHTGAFGIHAALQGAVTVEGLDSSAEALAAASIHAEINDVTAVCRFRQADVFEELPKLVRAGQRYDLIVLDPPAFAKTKHQVSQALAGYKQVNLRALQLLNPEGFLVSCSCSHHVGEQALLATILDAGRDAGRQLRLIETRSQGRDHPVLGAMPETRYLKCFLLQG